MKAVMFEGHGGPDVLKVISTPIPTFGSDEILIRVAAAGINGPDVWQRKGRYPAPQGSSLLPGLEVAGIVESVGAAVKNFKPGDHVMALVTGGGYAEYCVSNALTVMPKPTALTFIEAASLPETFVTTWLNMVRFGGFKTDKSILIHGGSGGIGVAATQIAKALGARMIITTVRSATKAKASVEIGAQVSINVNEEDFEKTVMEVTQGKGVDIILDIVAGDYLQKNINISAFGGKILQIGVVKGISENVNIMPLAIKHLSIIGNTLRCRTPEDKNSIIKDMIASLWPIIERGDLKPVVSNVFSLEDAREAHCTIDQGEHIGKLILKMPMFDEIEG